jgi:histidyl-tRNA synthetase
MRDFLPEAKARRERALTTIRQVYSQHGFDEIETPVMEDFDRLHSGLGGDNEKLSFSVLRRGLEPHELAEAATSGSTETLTDLGLRFDLTVPLARFYASHRAELPGVFRSIQIAPVWRAERPQKGRYRQFVQADIDIIGEPGLLAESELITATASALAALGLQGCVIRVNDRRLLSDLLSWCGFSAEQEPGVLIEIDKLDKLGAEKVIELVTSINADAAKKLSGMLTSLESAAASGQRSLTRESILSLLPDGVGVSAADSLVTLGETLTNLPGSISVVFDPTLVRGMGYYTGTIFEIAHPESGSSVGGGGRYDGMVGRFLGEDVPAAGFSIGFERIIDLIADEDQPDDRSLILLFDKDVPVADLLLMKEDFLRQGMRVRLERRAKNMNAQLERASAQGFRSFTLVTAEDTDSSRLHIKPLAGS